MRKIMALVFLTFALVAGTVAATIQLVPPAYADGNGDGGGH